ncbi:MAG: TIM barrel protein [Spirochaetaceae bacterium]|jgi:2-keto-myo-inositol isomerase|nr:TIM barrel protein [Spirochaetaceae bacterium]
MLTKNRIALNRIISPSPSLKDFFRLARKLGISKVELRNDLPGKTGVPGIVDGLEPAEAARMARDEGIEILTINALQKFNLPSERKSRIEELKQLLCLAAAIGCKAVVLCPNNEKDDRRSGAEQYRDTVDALAEYGPLFAGYGILGYIEALGFGISSLASLPSALGAIKASGFSCYKTLLDSFHHYIGPDTKTMFGMDGLGASYETAYTGLVHISGVEDRIPPEAYLDEHRVLVGPADTMGNKELVARLLTMGYAGDFSFEPFSEKIQKLPPEQLADALEASLQFLGAAS